MTALGSPDRSAGPLALAIPITALLAALALAPGCIIIGNASGGGGDCVNPFDDSCFNCPDGCGQMLDSDDDGVADTDEGACNLDPDSADTDHDGKLDGDEDLDGDGYPTDEELIFGSDCNDSADVPDEDDDEGEDEDEDAPAAADADDDGLSDEDEAARGTDPNNADSDGDGQCDKAEVDCRSSPLDPFFTCT